MTEHLPPVYWPDRKCVSCEALINEVKLLHEIIGDLRERLHDTQSEMENLFYERDQW